MWLAHRQAYFPRFWPGTLLACVLGGLTAWFAADTAWQGALLGMLVGTIILQGTYQRWKRKHPILSTDELIQRRRDTAKWN